MVERYHHGALREALVMAALDALENGDGAPSLRELARTVGVSAMAPYRHFSDRTALLGAVAEHGFAQLYRAVAEADRADDAQMALLAQGRAYVDFARAHPALFRLMFGGDKPGLQHGPPEQDSAYSVLAARVARIAPDTPGAAAAATLACWALVHGLATLLLDGRLGVLPDRMVDTTLGYIVAGVATGSTASPADA